MQDQFQTEIRLQASARRVWATLTQSDQIEQYMYGSRLEGDWVPGQRIAYVMDRDGQTVTMVHGTVHRVEPEQWLEHTLFPATWEGMPDIPENHLLIRYELCAEGEATLLRITQTGFATAAAGPERLEHTIKGWEAILPLLKQVAEQAG